jgi:hypothetical protein
MPPQHLNALHASVDQASCLPAWNGIADALGVSRRAGRHRFADKLD